MAEWWGEDSELLSMTLGLLVSWESETKYLSPSHSAPSSTVRSDASSPRTNISTTGASKRNVNKSRERRKQELQFLHKMAKDLETQLSALRDRRDKQLRPHYLDATRAQLATVAPVWERMAIRQFQSRKRSEAINARLKTMLSAHRRVAQDLSLAIQVAELRSREVVPAIPPMLRVSADASQRTSDEEQLTRLKSMCENWESEIRRCTKASNDARDPLQFMDLRVVDTSGDEAVVEMLMSFVLPYSVGRVGETVWSLRTDSGRAKDVDNGVSPVLHTEIMNNLAIGVYTSGTKIIRGRGSFHGKFVTKRLHITATHAIIATCMRSEADGSPNELDGVTTVEESWIRLIDANELGQTVVGTLTVVQHVRREHIIMSKTCGSVGIEAVAQAVMAQIREETALAQQLVEDMLTSGCEGDHVKIEMH